MPKQPVDAAHPLVWMMKTICNKKHTIKSFHSVFSGATDTANK